MKSSVLFEENICHVGNDTHKKIRGDLIANTKRIIGLSFRNPIVQRELQQLNLTVTEDPDTSQCPIIYNDDKTITPTDVAQIIFWKLESVLNQPQQHSIEKNIKI